MTSRLESTGTVSLIGAEIKAGDFTLGGTDGGALTGGKLESFTPLWLFDDHKRMVFSGDGYEPCGIAISAIGTNNQGAIISCFIPANEAGSLIIGSDFNTAKSLHQGTLTCTISSYRY